MYSRKGPCHYRNMQVHTGLQGITDTSFASFVARNFISAETNRNVWEVTLVYNPFIVQYLPINDSTVLVRQYYMYVMSQTEITSHEVASLGICYEGNGYSYLKTKQMIDTIIAYTNCILCKNKKLFLVYCLSKQYQFVHIFV